MPEFPPPPPSESEFPPPPPDLPTPAMPAIPEEQQWQMPKFTFNVQRTLLFVIVGLIVLACTIVFGIKAFKTPQAKLLGKWQEINLDQNVVEFFGDGTFSLQLKKNEKGGLENLTGKWIILPDGRIKMDISILGMNQSQVGKLEFHGQEMILTDEKGEATRHRRLPQNGVSDSKTSLQVPGRGNNIEVSGIPVRISLSGEGTAALTALDKEALQLAVEYWKPSKIGDSYYLRFIRRSKDPHCPNTGRAVVELKQVSLNLNPATIDEAGKLNGIEWQGSVDLQYGAGRFYVLERLAEAGFSWSGPTYDQPRATDKKWSEWLSAGSCHTLIFEKVRGKWKNTTPTGLFAKPPWPVTDLAIGSGTIGSGGNDDAFERVDPSNILDSSMPKHGSSHLQAATSSSEARPTSTSIPTKPALLVVKPKSQAGTANSVPRTAPALQRSQFDYTNRLQNTGTSSVIAPNNVASKQKSNSNTPMDTSSVPATMSPTVEVKNPVNTQLADPRGQTTRVQTAHWESMRGQTKLLDLGQGVKLELVFIVPGEFLMGSTDGDDDEKPVHRVQLTKGFWMGKYEVTQEQWKTMMGNNPSQFKQPQNPVEQVSWKDALEFCRKAGGRLPSEAEWEYACRAGTTTKYSSGDSEGDLDAIGWHKGNSGAQSHPVGQKAANAWGLYDMNGNVSEWCQDWRGNYSGSAVIDPVGPSSGQYPVVRGGSWSKSARRCRAAFRDSNNPDNFSNDIGFRVCLDVQ